MKGQQVSILKLTVAAGALAAIAAVILTDAPRKLLADDSDNRSGSVQPTFVTVDNWPIFRRILTVTSVWGGNEIPVSEYLGCDARFHYVYPLSTRLTIYKIEKQKVPEYELADVFQEQSSRAARLKELSLNIPFPSFSMPRALRQWERDEALDRSAVTRCVEPSASSDSCVDTSPGTEKDQSRPMGKSRRSTD